MSASNSRVNAWVWLALAVVAIDAAYLTRKQPSLSASFRAGMRHPVRRWFVLAAWLTLTSHLVIGKP